MLEKQYQDKLQQEKLREKQEYYENKAFEDNLLRAIEEREMDLLNSMKEHRPLQMETIEQNQHKMPIR